MAPNERGACSVCLTLSWECVCEDYARSKASAKRRRTQREAADSDSEVCYEDVIQNAQEITTQYGVVWDWFGSKDTALRQAVLLATQASTLAFYVGVSKEPAIRFYERSSAHCIKYQVMHPLAVGKKMGELETEVIRACREAASARCDNKGGGGEMCHPESVKFLYICLLRRLEA